MATMIAQTIQDLAKDLAKRRMVNDPPPVLLLGAGASAASGVTLMKHLFPAFDCTITEEFFQGIRPLSPLERQIAHVCREPRFQPIRLPGGDSFQA
jgi:hypothetical protein